MIAHIADRKMKILVVDDNERIHDDFRKILQRSDVRPTQLDELEASIFDESKRSAKPPRFDVDFAFQGQEGLELIRVAQADEDPYSVAIVDVRMPPGWDGVESIARFWQEDPDLEIVICSAHSDYSWRQIVDRLGRSDHLFTIKKPFDGTQVLQLLHSLHEKWELARRTRVQAAELSDQQAKYRNLFQLSRDAILMVDRRFTLVDANDTSLKLFGFDRRIDLLGHALDDLFANAECWDSVRNSLASGRSIDGADVTLRHRNRTTLDCVATIVPHPAADGRDLGYLCIFRDVTDAKRKAQELEAKEKELRWSQKMESIGTLAGGIAHEFNNLLQVILGNADLAALELPDGHEARECIEEIKKAGNRAATLTRQLLTFSHRQNVEPVSIDLNQSIRDLMKLLDRLLGADINLRVLLEAGSMAVVADAGMIEQILLNLCVNARDAMPAGGTLTVRTQRIVFDEDFCRTHTGSRPGPHIGVSVTDTGTGMTPDVLERVFEPFYTTKEAPKGTGLGLATVYAIVKQHEGVIYAYSEPGIGSTFKFYLPEDVSNKVASLHKGEVLDKGDLRGTETILVADDEAMILNLTVRILENAGYRVLTATNGENAVAIFEANVDDVALVLLDVIMPKMGGVRAYERIRRIKPDVCVLFCSGYGEEVFGKNSILTDRAQLIEKPVVPTKLLQAVRSTLDAKREPSRQSTRSTG